MKKIKFSENNWESMNFRIEPLDKDTAIGLMLKFVIGIVIFLSFLLLFCVSILASYLEYIEHDNSVEIFINGRMITGYDYEIKNDRLYVPLEFIQKELNASIVLENSLNGTVDNNSPSVPLRVIAKNLGMTVTYAPPLMPPYVYYYDTRMPVSPEKTIIRNNPNVIIDSVYEETAVTKEEAFIITQELCLKALGNFRRSLSEELERKGFDPEKYHMECDGIENEINRMMYLGEISRFYKFTIGPYDVLCDKYNRTVYFIIYSSSTIFKEVDVNDGSIYMPIFIIG